MFSEMIETLAGGGLPEPGPLRQRFDMAATKKTAIVKLPPAFWMKDPKINPPAGHLLWAALLLGDRERIDMAVSIIAAELAENKNPGSLPLHERMPRRINRILEQLLEVFPDPVRRRIMAVEFQRLLPRWPTGQDQQHG